MLLSCLSQNIFSLLFDKVSILDIFEQLLIATINGRGRSRDAEAP
jgi:hypothetical protein